MLRTTHDNALLHLPSDNPGGAKPVNRKPFGKHLIIDLVGCNTRVKDAEAIAIYAVDLVEILGMKAFGPPQIVHFGHADPATSGYTLIQLIETSSITGHFVDRDREAHLDLFSCKDYDDERALHHAERFFSATASVATVLYR